MSKSAPIPKFLNRELSWLEFNQRVLDEATDESLPLLERLKFLAITSSNLDEFFMVRVGGLQMLRKSRGSKRDPAGLTPVQQLKAVSQRAHRMVEDQYRCLLDQLEPGLSQAGIQRVTPGQLTEHQEAVVQKIFDSEVFPVYTPMAVPADDEFPLLINKALHMCVRSGPGGRYRNAAVCHCAVRLLAAADLPPARRRGLPLHPAGRPGESVCRPVFSRRDGARRPCRSGSRGTRT